MLLPLHTNQPVNSLRCIFRLGHKVSGLGGFHTKGRAFPNVYWVEQTVKGIKVDVLCRDGSLLRSPGPESDVANPSPPLESAQSPCSCPYGRSSWANPSPESPKKPSLSVYTLSGSINVYGLEQAT